MVFIRLYISITFSFACVQCDCKFRIIVNWNQSGTPPTIGAVSLRCTKSKLA